jgi:hypothetical protein
MEVEAVQVIAPVAQAMAAVVAGDIFPAVPTIQLVVAKAVSAS